MSEVERFWEAVRFKWSGDIVQKPWNELSPEKQQLLMQIINMIIHAMHIE